MYEKWSTRDRGSKLDENWIFQFFSYEFQLRITQIVSRSFDLSNIVIPLPHISTILKRKKPQNSSSNNPPPCFIPKNNRVWIIARIYSRDRILIGVRNTCLSLSLSRERGWSRLIRIFWRFARGIGYPSWLEIQRKATIESRPLLFPHFLPSSPSSLFRANLPPSLRRCKTV